MRRHLRSGKLAQCQYEHNNRDSESHTDAERNGIQNLKETDINNQEGGAGGIGGTTKRTLICSHDD